MPAAVRNANGSVTVNGVTLTREQALAAGAAANAPAPALRPLVITTGSGKVYGKTGTPRFGIFYDKVLGSWVQLDENMRPIHNTSWKEKNLNRASFKFGAKSA